MNRKTERQLALEVVRRAGLPEYYARDKEFLNSEFYQVHREIYEGL